MFSLSSCNAGCEDPVAVSADPILHLLNERVNVPKLCVDVGDGLSDDTWHVATMGVTSAGLGLRPAKGLAPAAFVASRVASRPRVEAVAVHLEAAT